MKKFFLVLTLLSMFMTSVCLSVQAEDTSSPYEKLNFVDADYKTVGSSSEKSDDGDTGVGGVTNKYLIFRNVDFGNDGAAAVEIKYSSEADSTIYLYAVDIGANTAYECESDGSIAALAGKQLRAYSCRNTGTWTAQATKYTKLTNKIQAKGKKDLVVSFGGYGNFYSLKFEENAENTKFDPYSPMKFADASYTNANVSDDSMQKYADGTAVTGDYRGLNDVSGKYAAFKDVELNGVTRINVTSSVMWDSSLSTVYIVPANTTDVTALTVTGGKVDGLTEVKGVWNTKNNSWVDAQTLGEDIANGKSYIGTYDIIVSFSDNSSANYWNIYFEGTSFTDGVSSSDGNFKGKIEAADYAALIFDFDKNQTDEITFKVKKGNEEIISDTISVTNAKTAIYAPENGINIAASSAYSIETNSSAAKKVQLIEKGKIQTSEDFNISKYIAIEGHSWNAESNHFGGTVSGEEISTVDYIIDFGTARLYKAGVMYATPENGVGLSVALDGNTVANPLTPSSGGFDKTAETSSDIEIPLSGIHKITYSYTGFADLYNMWFENVKSVYSQTEEGYVTYVDMNGETAVIDVITVAYANDGKVISVDCGSSVNENGIIKNTAAANGDGTVSVSTYIWYNGTIKPFADKKVRR